MYVSLSNVCCIISILVNYTLVCLHGHLLCPCVCSSGQTRRAKEEVIYSYMEIKMRARNSRSDPSFPVFRRNPVVPPRTPKSSKKSSVSPVESQNELVSYDIATPASHREDKS
ncbi:hypothetical protein F5X97DRAFT_45578 [Nemania serpens]|nr:hypothetical protein F5X97DRAFT_45578 [Nemania serpens]